MGGLCVSLDARCICGESTGRVRPRAGAGAGRGAGAALENEEKTSRQSRTTVWRWRHQLGGMRPLLSARQAARSLSVDSKKRITELWPGKQGTSFTNWSMFVCREKHLGGSKNKAIFQGGANTWVGVQQDKRFFSVVEEQKVWASLGVPVRTTWGWWQTWLKDSSSVSCFSSWAKFGSLIWFHYHVSSQDSGISWPLKERLLFQHHGGGAPDMWRTASKVNHEEVVTTAQYWTHQRKTCRNTQMIYEIFIVNSLKNVTYFSFCEKQNKKNIGGTFHSDIIRLHTGSPEQGGEMGVAGPRNNPATGSDVARPTFWPRDQRCWWNAKSSRVGRDEGRKRRQVPFKPAALFSPSCSDGEKF